MKIRIALCLSLALSAPALAQNHADMHKGHGKMHQGHGDGHMMQEMHEKHHGAEVKTVTTTGIVKKIHQDRDMLTITHDPVPELDWPTMTMGFKASTELMEQVQEGDRIRFEFTSEGMNNTIVSITPE
jgi:Cu(I)/Ag(I) efflux system periplasmic protein CusF